MGGGEGWVGWGGAGGAGGSKNFCLGHPKSSHDAHTVTNDTPVGHIVSGCKPRSPLPIWCPQWVPLFQPCLWQNSLEKSRPVNI